MLFPPHRWEGPKRLVTWKEEVLACCAWQLHACVFLVAETFAQVKVIGERWRGSGAAPHPLWAQRSLLSFWVGRLLNGGLIDHHAGQALVSALVISPSWAQLTAYLTGQPSEWTILDVQPSRAFRWLLPSYYMIATAWEISRDNCPAELFLNSWPTKPKKLKLLYLGGNMLCSNTASNKNQKVQTVTVPGGYDCNHIRDAW